MTAYDIEGLLAEMSPSEKVGQMTQVEKFSMTPDQNDDAALPIGADDKLIFVGGQAADNIGIQSGGWTIEWQGKQRAITPGTRFSKGSRRPSLTMSPSTTTGSGTSIGSMSREDW
jgi:hypothetical protein